MEQVCIECFFFKYMNAPFFEHDTRMKQLAFDYLHCTDEPKFCFTKQK